MPVQRGPSSEPVWVSMPQAQNSRWTQDSAPCAAQTSRRSSVALAIEHQAEPHSTDADMVRFPGLRWANPLT